MKTSVSVCLCTFRRTSLAATLESLAAQRLPAGMQLEVVVVDSDLAGSGWGHVEQAMSTLPINIRYVVAASPGVAAARNRALEEARGEWLAFIDDDEVAAPNWVAELFKCAIRTKAQVVFGLVRSVYPVGCADWIREGDLFGRTLPPTGTQVDHGPTGNALLARSVLAPGCDRFDVAYGATGGEDTEFFFRLSRTGTRMVVCREAVVSETVEEQRLNRRFLLKKAVRVGETYFRIFYTGAGCFKRGVLISRALAQCIVAACLAAALRPGGLGRSMVYQIKAASNLGKVRAALGFRGVELYKG